MSQREKENLKPSDLCRRGQWKRVTHWLTHNAWKQLSHEERSWCLYALYFSGSWTEAESWRQLWFPVWQLETLSHLFFAHCIALARRGHLQQARLQWIQHWHGSRLRKIQILQHQEKDSQTSTSTFQIMRNARGWMFQAHSFLQMQRSRWSSASRWAEWAECESVYSSNLMLRSMATDMQAHASVKHGYYSNAILNAQKALYCARHIENKGIENAIRVSIACWQSERGEHLEKSLRTLRSLLNEKSFHDTYSQLVLLLETSRTLMIQGKFELAKKALIRAEKSLTGIGDKPFFRQKIALAQRKALLLRLEGRPMIALSELEFIFQEIPTFELSLRLEVRGQMVSACLEAQIPPPAEWLEEEKNLTSLLRTPRAMRTIQRRNHLHSAYAELSDPLGEMLDSLHSQERKMSIPFDFIARGFSGLLASKIKRTHENILLLLPGGTKLLILNSTGLKVCEEQLSNQLVNLAKSISFRLCNKDEIVKKIWNRSYRPERDDPGVYVLVRRLRRILGEQSNLLESKHGGYILNAEVAHWPTEPTHQHKLLPSLPIGNDPVQNRVLKVEPQVSSLRLLQFAEWMKSKTHFTAQDWEKESNISRASACRDIAQLVAAGEIKKVGRGPASVYMAVKV